MANQTINGLAPTAAWSPGDWLPIWKSALGQTRKIDVANLMGGVLTGGGTLVNAFIATVPRSGTLVTAYAVDDYVPVINGSISNPTTITYTAQASSYKKIDELVIYDFVIVVATIAGGSGDIRVSLPFTVRGGNNDMYTSMIFQSGLNATSGECMAYTLGGQNFMRIRKDNVNFTIAQLGAGDAVQGSLIFRASV